MFNSIRIYRSYIMKENYNASFKSVGADACFISSVDVGKKHDNNIAKKKFSADYSSVKKDGESKRNFECLLDNRPTTSLKSSAPSDYSNYKQVRSFNTRNSQEGAPNFPKNRNFNSKRFGSSSTENRPRPSDSNWFLIGNRHEGFEKKHFDDGVIKSGINFDKYDDIPIALTGKSVNIDPANHISDSKISEVFYENLTIAGYTKLTPIQKYAFPCLLGKHDLLGCAQTGSGKTVAFVLPVLHHIYNEGFYRPHDGRSNFFVFKPKALILAPTRELASQIYDVAVKFSYRTPIRPAVVYGGININKQMNDMVNCGHLLVGTPGRISDLYRRGYLSFQNCKYVVFDEADRMLDMGFEPQINEIVLKTDMPKKQDRLNCMFSATFQDDVKRLVSNYMNEHITLTVGKVGGTTDNIRQTIHHVQPHEKFDMLMEQINHEEKILVFTETKFEADRVEMSLFDSNHKVVCIHGDRTQNERDLALLLFKSNKANIMVATGVASRGLDIPNVKKVIIYDCPKQIEEYVHRIGRTGRAGNTGEAVTFFCDDDANMARGLAGVLTDSKQDVPSFLMNCQSSNSRGMGGYGFKKNKGGFGRSKFNDFPRRGRSSGGDGFNSRFGSRSPRNNDNYSGW